MIRLAHGCIIPQMADATPLLIGICLLTAISGCTSNRAPVFEPIEDRTLRVGETARFAVSAVDRDGDAIRYGVRGLPEGARFETGSKPPEFVWSPVASDADGAGRPHPITFTATDDADARVEARVVITVFPGVTRPTFTSPLSHVFDVRVQPVWEVLVTARDDDDVELDFELVEAPEGLEMKAREKSVRLSWAPTPDQLARRKVFAVALSARDDDVEVPVVHRMTVLVLGD